MPIISSVCAVVGLAFLVGTTHAGVLGARQNVAATEYFGSLYCYGEGIQGLPVYYADGESFQKFVCVVLIHRRSSNGWRAASR